MKFELKLTYPNLPGNDRKSLHVDEEAFAAIHQISDAPNVDDRLEVLLPPEVVTELKRPTYQGVNLICGMNIVVDKAG